MTLKKQLILELQKVLNELGVEDVVPSVDYPADPKHGDYSSNVALIAAKKLDKNPREFAEELRLKIQDLGFVEKVEIAGPGFINFWIKDEVVLSVIASEGEAISDVGKGKKVIVEYSSPNIAKPFTVGHLRSTIIGDAIANLLEATGWEVYKDNHVGDWGTQFGKQIYAIKKWGNEEEIEKSERPVKLLVALYVKFHEESEKDPTLEDKAREWFKKLENGDEEAKNIWQKCIDWSWKEFEEIYKKLGVSFTENGGRGYGESFFEDKMEGVIKELEDKDLLKEGENGAKLVFYPKDEFTPLMILKKDGATLYSTRDLATDKFRSERYGKYVTIINEVGAEQEFYFRQLYKLEEMLLWYKKGQRIHKKHGLYRFKEGKMSTRKGNVIWLEDVLDEAINHALALMLESKKGKRSNEIVIKNENDLVEEGEGLIIDYPKELVNAVAIGALKWNDLKRSSEQDIVFDWDEILNMQGNSGPYIQYTYARTQSVIQKSEIQNPKPETNTKYEILNTKYQLEPEERELLKLLSRFPEIVGDAAERLSPNLLCTFLFELAQVFNLFYQKCPILKSEKETQQFRLFLTDATGNVLKKGLSLLGINAPEKM